ncbi:hypothetical protein IWW36_001903 [Coemansia brasiliensis]|uniref:DUF2428 domain-containing protein n=1 Tax=Coemansia brasiliensis TaxID=2650707 RepID=A0A9W8LYN1_9FUNG|nr:hypothetical protein IWW36_001903 [Coemansia brasiliensis]
MGILQKDRRGTRALKPPIPVPDIWTERIKVDQETDDEAASDQEMQLMQRVRSDCVDLATQADITWLEQSKLLKSIDMSLSGLRKLPQVSLSTLSYLRQVAIPMFVECYFMPNDMAVRRQAIPLIKVSSALDPSCVDNVLQANLLAFVGMQEKYHEMDVLSTADREVTELVYARQLVGQRAQALEVLASVPQGFPVIRRFVSDVLAFAANSLDDALPQLRSPRKGLGSVELVALRDDCTQLMRLVFMCLSKLLAEDVGTKESAVGDDLLTAILASMRTPSPGFVEQTLTRVYALSWDLIGCEHAAINSRQVAAMVLVSLIEGAGLSKQNRAVALAKCALDIDVQSNDSDSCSGAEHQEEEPLATYVPVVDDSSSRAQCMDDAVSMICIARAIVSLASYETTLVPLSMIPSVKLPSVCNNVHEAVFTHIASICGRSQLAPGVKVVVFESMAIWLQETAKLLARCLNSLQSADRTNMDAYTAEFNNTAFALGQRVLILQRERIMGYLWSYWDDPIDAVQAKVRIIFEAFLDIGSTMNQAIVSDPSIAECALNTYESQSTAIATTAASMHDSNAFIRDVLDLVLTMDWSRKVKYSLLAALCPRIDVLVLLQEHPEILSSCLETMAQVTMASRAAQLLTALLSCAADDIDHISDPLGKCSQLTAEERQVAALELETKHVTLWVPPVVEALCRDDDTSRRMLTQQLLPKLFGSLPRIVSHILKALVVYERPLNSNSDSDISNSNSNISNMGRVAAAQQQQSLDACRQHALIVVLKVARSQDIISIDQLVTMDDQNPSIADRSSSSPPSIVASPASSSVIDMLNQAVFHPDLTVRADMLGLLCESRKLATPLSEIEYDLLFKLLRVSASAPSADFRQQQFGALTTLAARLVTVATHADRIVTTGRPPVPSQKIRHRERARREQAVARGKAEGKSEEQVLRELGILSQDEMVAQAHITLEQVKQAVHRWLDLAVRGCLYPGAGFAKVAMGLRWLDILTAFFTPGRPAQAPESAMAPFAVQGLSSPRFNRGQQPSSDTSAAVTAEEVVTVLTQVLIDDPFDANRAGAFALLTSWPLVPEDDSEAAAAAQAWANQLLRRALHLVNSTRAQESESGALIIRWLFRKFVVLQDMRLEISLQADSSDKANDVAFANGLLMRIIECRKAAEHNLLNAAQQFPLHGLLTAAQYVSAEIDFASPTVQTHAEEWRLWLKSLAQAAMDICRVVLSVLTSPSPEGNIPSSFREMETKIDDIIRSAEGLSLSDTDAPSLTDDSDDDDDDIDDGLLGGTSGLGGPAGPRQQVILSYCWRAIKEVSGLLSSVAVCPPGDDQKTQATAGSLEPEQVPLMDAQTLGQIGDLLHTLLTSIRHRGAFSAVHPAFTVVCKRMFGSCDAELNERVGKWLDQCLDIATICRVSVTRRSAGWPLCLLSILTCDKLATQALLPRAMDRLFALASDLQLEGAGDDGTNSTTDLPQVHAINMLRALLDDHALGPDIVPYIEHAFVLALTGLQSRRWAIRNVCSLLYAALTRRVFGNNRTRDESKYDGITGRELFTRFPGLHPFLTNQLEDAVDKLAEVDLAQEGPAGDGRVIIEDADKPQCEANKALMHSTDPVTAVLRSGARFIHPALYPCLILLARLQPTLTDASSQPQQSQKQPEAVQAAGEAAGVIAASPHAESATGAVAPPMNLDREPLTRVNERNSTVHVTSASTMLSMYSFTELVEMCVDSPVCKTREMAARAFAPLVPSERAAAVVTSVLKHIKEAGATMAANTCHGALCQVHELLRVHWRINNEDEVMRRSFITQVLPVLTALWPILIQRIDGPTAHDNLEGDNFDVSDVIRHKFLVIINEYVARGEQWLLPGLLDATLVRAARLLLSRFRLTVLYGTLHPMFSQRQVLMQLGNSQVPGAYGTVLELVRLFLACVDDCTMAVLRSDGSVQLRIDGDLVDEHGTRVLSPADALEDAESHLNSSRSSSGIGGGSSEVLYSPWSVLGSILTNNDFYEAKLEALEWMLDHADNERMHVIERIGIDNLLPLLITDTCAINSIPESQHEQQPQAARDPLVRAAAIRLLALMCTHLEIDSRTLPVRDVVSFWDTIVAQLDAKFCPLSVSTALVELQAALVHLLMQHPDASQVNQRTFAWAQQIYSWSDPERAAPYRHAVSRALVTYSAIKRYIEAGSTSNQFSSISVDAPSEQILRLCYWRLLQDDDADIREYIAQTISRRLGRELACDQACEKLVVDFCLSAHMPFPDTYVRNRVQYILGLGSLSVSQAVQQAISPNSALFAHENPNIYIDEPRNVQLAYYSLISIAHIYAEEHQKSNDAGDSPLQRHVTGMAEHALQCVDALDAARLELLQSRELALDRGVVLSGVLGASSLPQLFSLLQSWILGARLVLFTASRIDTKQAHCMASRTLEVALLWLESKELHPLHPWVFRSLCSLQQMAQDVLKDNKPLSKSSAVSDLFLLTYV